jgi:hypothetical protein
MVRVCRSLKLNAMSMGNFADAASSRIWKKPTSASGLSARRAGALARLDGAEPPLGLRREAVAPRALHAVQHPFLRHDTALARPLPDKGYWEHVYFSGITYLTVGYGDLAPHAPFARALSVAAPRRASHLRHADRRGNQESDVP